MKKKPIYLLFLCIILTSCISTDELQGDWIGAYQVHYSSSEPCYSTIRGIIDFDNNKVNIKTFNYPLFNEIDTSYSLAYKIIGNRIKIRYNDKNTYFRIKSITADSLVIRLHNSYKRDFVFKKLDLCVSPKDINILGKAYTLTIDNYNDSIEFFNDSILFHISCLDYIYNVNSWSINNYKEMKFLLIDNPIEYPPLLIKSQNHKSINFETYWKVKSKAYLTQINQVKDTTGLYGTWVCTSEPLPQLPINYKGDSILRITFKKDSLIYKQYNQTIRIGKIRLSTLRDYIIFSENNQDGSYKIWQIKEIRKEKLTLRMPRRGYSLFPKYDIIEFKKEEKI